MNLLKPLYFYFFAIAFFVATLFSQLAIYFDILPYYRYTSVVNFVFEIFLFLCLILNFRNFKKIVIPLFLFFFFFIGQFVIKGDVVFLFEKKQFLLKGYMYLLNGYLFIFLFYTVLQKVENRKELANKVFKLFLWVFNVNSVIILFAWLTKSPFFTSYFRTDRFGYIGVLGHNTLMFYMYCLLILYLYFMYMKYKTNKFYLYNLFFQIFISLLSGKKGIFLFLFFLSIYHIFYSFKKYKYFLFSLITLALLTAYNFKDRVLEFLVELFPFWKPLAQKWDVFTLMFSTRDLSLIRFKNYILENWSFVNYLFGGANYPENWVEMSGVDLFSFFGLIGFFIYFYWIWTKMYLISIRYRVLISIVIGVSLFCGNFLTNINLVVFFVYLLIIMQEKHEHNLI